MPSLWSLQCDGISAGACRDRISVPPEVAKRLSKYPIEFAVVSELVIARVGCACKRRRLAARVFRADDERQDRGFTC